MIGWHGTHGAFNAFEESFFGSYAGRSPNGRLGVWVYLEEGLAESAGPRVLRVEADVDESRTAVFTVKRMLDDHMASSRTESPHGFFEDLRAELLAAGYQAIKVTEHDGRAAMAIILDLACIGDVTEMSAAPSP